MPQTKTAPTKSVSSKIAMPTGNLAQSDPEIARFIDLEVGRQRSGLELIAAFEQEFVYTGNEERPGDAYSLGAFRRAGSEQGAPKVRGGHRDSCHHAVCQEAPPGPFRIHEAHVGLLSRASQRARIVAFRADPARARSQGQTALNQKPADCVNLVPGDPSMRTVVGSRGYWAVDLLFRAELGGKAVAQSPQDRRSAARQYPDTRHCGLSVQGRARDLDVPGGKRPPAIHSRTRRMKSCSISTTADRRGGAAQSVNGHDRPWITPSTPALEQVPWEDRVSPPPPYAAAGAGRPRRRNSS